MPRFDPWVRKIPLEKGMATRSSILPQRIPWAEEPGGPLSLGLWECDCPRACLHSGVSDYKEHLSGNENSKGKTYKSVTEGTASCRSSGSVVWFRANNCSELAL